MVLGFGAHAGAKHLKLQYDIWQGNDCHCVFAFLALLKEAMEGGMGLNAAVKYVKCQSAFTTHTAVEAGNYAADLGLLMHLLQDPTLSEQLLATVGCGKTPGVFSFTAACFNLSGVANAVSKKHRLISQDLWSSCIDVSHLTHVTNGTNLRYWQHQDFIRANTPREVRDAKKAHAMALRAYVLGKTDTSLAENAPTIVWARRFAEYKRPGLLPFMAHEWFEQRLKESAFNYIVAGKPHPDDEHMIRVWNELSAMSRTLPNFVVLEDYDMPRSKLLKCGADVWLNTPRAPNEACGTSGMSGNFNGAMHVSTPDGWAAEANPDNCFLFGGDSGDDPSECLQDRFDIGQLVPTLERTLHEHGTDAWWTRVLRAKKETQLMFSSERMVQDYRYRVWEPLLNKSDRLQTAVLAA